MRPQLRAPGADGADALGRHHIGGERGVAMRRASRQHSGIPYAVERRQARLDLTELDAEAADLDLMIVATEELDVAIGAVAPEIAGAVNPRTVARREWVRGEAFRREINPVEIAPRNPCSTDPDLADRATGHRPPQIVEQIDARIGDRSSDRNGPIGKTSGTTPCGGADGGFGRPVGIEHGDAERQRRDEFRLWQFAGKHQGLQNGQTFQVRPALQHRRRQCGMRDAMIREIVEQHRGIAVCVAADQMQLGTRTQRHDDVPDARIEAEGRELYDTAVALDFEERDLGQRKIHQAAVFDHHTLRLARGAGGIDDVGEMARRQAGNHGRDVGHVMPFRRMSLHVNDRARDIAELLGAVVVAQQQHRFGVGQDLTQPLCRVHRVERQIGSSCLENREQADDRVDTALLTDCHQAIGSRTVLEQMMS